MSDVSVEYTKENVAKCKCMECGVQAEAPSAVAGDAKLAEILKDQDAEFLGPDEMCRCYCAWGFSRLADIDISQTCICSSCEVYGENGLAKWRYCQLGTAEKVG